jgi:hypothetical protein
MRTKLSAARKAPWMTHAQVGRCLGKGHSAIAKYAAGETDMPGSMLYKLALILGIAVDDVLFDASGPPRRGRPEAPHA